MSEQIQNSTEILGNKIERKKDYTETEQDVYAKLVFQKSMNIISTFEQLEFIPIFVKRFPIRKYYNDNGINHPKYLQYHIENHYLKISTILDQSIILVSEVFRLGIPPKLTSLNQLQQNRFTKDEKAVKLLKEFQKRIQGIKNMRNLIMHRGEFSDAEIDEIGMYYFVSENSEKDEEIIVPNFYLECKMREIVKSKKLFLTKNNEAIFKLITILFKLLELDFDSRFEKLK